MSLIDIRKAIRASLQNDVVDTHQRKNNISFSVLLLSNQGRSFRNGMQEFQYHFQLSPSASATMEGCLRVGGQTLTNRMRPRSTESRALFRRYCCWSGAT